MNAPITGYFTLNSARAGGSVPNPAVQGSTLDRWYSDFTFSDGAEFKDCYWLRQPGKDAPTPGEAFYGEMESGSKGYRFRSKQAPPDGAPPENVAASGGGAPPRIAGSGPQGDRQHSIERQHSQEMALRFAAIGEMTFSVADDAQVDAALKRLAQITDWFQRDIRRNPSPANE